MFVGWGGVRWVNSLVVQWLGVSVFTLVAQVQSLVGELRSHKPRGVAKKKKRKKQEQGGRDLHILQQCILDIDNIYSCLLLFSWRNYEEKGKKVFIMVPYWLNEPFPGGSEGKESAYSAWDLGLIPGLGRSPEEGNGNPLQYSCLENPMDRGAWWATVHRVTKSWIWLSNFTFFLSLLVE